MLFWNWLQAAFVAKDLTLSNNADNISQLQIDPKLLATFTLDQSSTFYNNLLTKTTMHLAPPSPMES